MKTLIAKIRLYLPLFKSLSQGKLKNPNRTPAGF